MMEKLLAYLVSVIDRRQASKVRHKMGDIIALVFFASLGNADDWVEIEAFAEDTRNFCAITWNFPGVYRHMTRFIG